MEDFFNIDNSRSFSTEKNLEKALTKKGLNKVRHLVVCNRQGRFTSVFSLSRLEEHNIAPVTVANLGYMVIG